MRTFVKFFGVALIVGLFLAPSPRAEAAEMTWYFGNDTNQVIAVQLYSDARPHVWPGADTTWLIPTDGKRYTDRITCVAGEKICYGAWVVGYEYGISWGTGYRNRLTCRNCCGTCGLGYITIPNFVP